MEDDYEFVLLRKNNVNLFKLPTRNILGTKGHYLNSWKENFWAGNLVVKAKGDILTVEFLNLDESLYAKCHVGKNKKKSLDKTMDSARGILIKV